MFPKWFDKWNRDNPTNVYGPGILVGVLGGAVFVAIMLVTLGQPHATASLQTGPRGTGMSVTEFQADLATPDPDIALIFEDPPFPPEPGEPLAGDIYENVQVLGDLTDANFNRVMAAMTRWVSPEQGCAYCHGDGDLETYGEDNLYTKVVARRMIQMTQNINENWDGHVNANKEVGVTCMTCHRGQNVPSEVWFREAPVVSAMAGWSATQNRATETSQYTSLPSDALESYLLDYQRIGVHDLASRVEGSPSDPAVPAIQNAERTYALMNYFANSLGANCVTCHNSRAFYDGVQVTPQWSTASLGIAMVQELNNDYLVGLLDLYPEDRLGPVHQDAPKAACATCHKGYLQPLQGTNVIADWPELATSGPPAYGEAE
ncbi:photosynthetic reaction center cytochrome PufC [Salibaculum griseiflavum]|uniref:Photosynthetic reaction center cytochrome c subunit n=1 Tax=Salibaculum griseiflavum TaxID=1914409 RepID=A0A2V1P3D0_9RHOB|nr:photosynthetic reaction center cytochrome PufC [Salibaculum griseiflavum]PWG15812.1 photosynthetic reaction center cytochrome c subunit [Salibaculum griseiflavum]